MKRRRECAGAALHARKCLRLVRPVVRHDKAARTFDPAARIVHRERRDHRRAAVDARRARQRVSRRRNSCPRLPRRPAHAAAAQATRAAATPATVCACAAAKAGHSARVTHQPRPCAGSSSRRIRRRLTTPVEQPAFDEHLRLPRPGISERGEFLARAQRQLMIEQVSELQIEAVLQIRADVVGQVARAPSPACR